MKKKNQQSHNTFWMPWLILIILAGYALYTGQIKNIQPDNLASGGDKVQIFAAGFSCERLDVNHCLEAPKVGGVSCVFDEDGKCTTSDCGSRLNEWSCGLGIKCVWRKESYNNGVFEEEKCEYDDDSKEIIENQNSEIKEGEEWSEAQISAEYARISVELDELLRNALRRPHLLTQSEMKSLKKAVSNAWNAIDFTAGKTNTTIAFQNLNAAINALRLIVDAVNS